MIPDYNLDKIKFSTDGSTFEKAVGIYESSGIKNFEDNGFGFTAKVRGSSGNFYKVYISAKHHDHGNCECYLGQNDILCKHLIAAAIYAIMRGKKLSDGDKRLVNRPICSGHIGTLNEEELAEVKGAITTAMRYIKPYNGPSRIWFAYQNSLSEGCNRLTAIISELPISEQTAKLTVNLLLRLDKKLCTGGVDDSDGTVGGFIEETVIVLQEYTNFDSTCARAFSALRDKETCFGWEESLVKITDNNVFQHS